ncbi:Permease of the drug/metabolite transporter (DMT) superfamily [hydrothermal vent metagenome]|uniref:Permease of the drug/metabolite transporter (DMT) superfamily n=1 Tax=hydrothermal vent metagenome TaxID=652676 RepID=A0A3B0TEH5_9ZZZZ
MKSISNIPHSSLVEIDYTIVILYLLVLVGFALYMKITKKSGTDTESYFLGGRKIPGWLNGISYAATSMNTDVAPAYSGMTVISGAFIYWWYISRFSIALMIGAVLFAVLWRRLKLITSPEFYEIRFSGNAATVVRSWVAIRSAFISVVAWTGAGLLGLHKIALPLLGWDMMTTLAIIIPIVLFYVLLSGYIGVVISDFFQTFIIIVSSFLLMCLVLQDFSGGEGIINGTIGLKNALLNQFGEGVVSWHPPKSHELLGMIGIIAWMVGSSVGYGGDVAPMSGAMEGQRILSCKNENEASKMYIWTEITLFLMLTLLTLPALGAMVKWPGLHDGTINKELAYGMLLNEYLPTGLLGLAVSGILASVMSTISSNMNFGAQVFVNDVYKRLFVKKATERHYLIIGRYVATVIVALAIIVAVRAENVIDIAIFMLGISSAELTANWAQWWWWRFNAKARLAASFGGPIIFIINKFIVFKYFIDMGDDTAYIIVLTSMAITFVFWVSVALLTEPESDEKLIAFYKRAKPMGWWGDIPKKAGITESSKPRKVIIGLAIAIVGAIAISSGTISFNSLYIAQWDTAIYAGIICMVFAIAFRILFKKYNIKNND